MIEKWIYNGTCKVTRVAIFYPVCPNSPSHYKAHCGLFLVLFYLSIFMEKWLQVRSYLSPFSTVPHIYLYTYLYIIKQVSINALFNFLLHLQFAYFLDNWCCSCYINIVPLLRMHVNELTSQIFFCKLQIQYHQSHFQRKLQLHATPSPITTVWKNEKFTITWKKIRETNYIINLTLIKLISRNLCEKLVRV